VPQPIGVNVKGKPILCLDFDGVCHSYTTGWKGVDVIPDEPVPGMWRFLEAAIQQFDIHIYSSRSHEPKGRVAMQQWFLKHANSGFQQDIARKWLVFPTKKPPALVTLDDRALTFDSSWPSVQTLLDFKPWNKKG